MVLNQECGRTGVPSIQPVNTPSVDPQQDPAEARHARSSHCNEPGEQTPGVRLVTRPGAGMGWQIGSRKVTEAESERSCLEGNSPGLCLVFISPLLKFLSWVF